MASHNPTDTKNNSTYPLKNYFSPLNHADIENTEHDNGNGNASTSNAEDLEAYSSAQELFETDKLLIEGIPINTSEECLKGYIERISGLAVKNITYSTECSYSGSATEKSHSSTAGKTDDVQWMKRSKKHRSKLAELVDLLKTDPSKPQRIGIYRVCFEDKFSIGEGCDGTKVYVGLADDGLEVAVKRMSHEKCQQMGINEKKILNCPNVQNEKHIVNYRYCHVPNSETAYLVLDLHEETLYNYVEDPERTVEQLLKEGPSIIRQILYGIKALHCCQPEIILHRDLKPWNILVNVEGEMVLTDFGVSKTLQQDADTHKSEFTGTQGWTARESLPQNDDEEDSQIEVRYKKESDIQVLGMICYYVLTKGKHPYGNPFFRNGKILIGDYNLRYLHDPCATDLITWMLQHDPEKRPNVHECLKHPYFQQAQENFNFVTYVGDEIEIKENDTKSVVVNKINSLTAFQDWFSKIEDCVMKHMTAHRRKKKYTTNVVDLLRFFRNMATHWPSAKSLTPNVHTTVVTPKEYFEKKFPTLPVELHRIIRQDDDWKKRENLEKYF